MLSLLDQKKIKFKLKNLYNSYSTKKEIDYYFKEVFQIINKFNKEKSALDASPTA